MENRLKFPAHLISIQDLTAEQVVGLFELTAALKQRPDDFRQSLAGRTLAMVFQKPSTRTRVSFEVGMLELGGHALNLSAQDMQLSRGESIADTARVLSRYVDAIMARTFAHQDVLDLAREGRVPVVNGLTDELHPCQGLADYFTLQEIFGSLRGRKLAYVGDGNNVAHSLLFGASRVGMDVAVASPQGHEVQDSYLAAAQRDAASSGTQILLTRDPREAVSQASAVYTDAWTSMGQEGERERRLAAFEGYMVDSALLEMALSEAVFLHCLPCHRGEEVAAEVADGPQSRIFDQAENRLHVQKAVLLRLLEDGADASEPG